MAKKDVIKQADRTRQFIFDECVCSYEPELPVTHETLDALLENIADCEWMIEDSIRRGDTNSLRWARRELQETKIAFREIRSKLMICKEQVSA